MTFRLRFAPSPTGFLHLGGARTALFNWLAAKAQGGAFLLRIEDTDVVRSAEHFAQAIIEDLRWLGISSDEPIVVQSHNTSYHKQVAVDLLKKGFCYVCTCDSAKLQDLRQQQGENFKYPRFCKNNGFELYEELSAKKQPFAIRFQAQGSPENILRFQDLIKGEIAVAADVLDDFVIFKSDGIATYNFAVVLDDASMESHTFCGVKSTF